MENSNLTIGEFIDALIEQFVHNREAELGFIKPEKKVVFIHQSVTKLRKDLLIAAKQLMEKNG